MEKHLKLWFDEGVKKAATFNSYWNILNGDHTSHAFFIFSLKGNKFYKK